MKKFGAQVAERSVGDAPCTEGASHLGTFSPDLHRSTARIIERTVSPRRTKMRKQLFVGIAVLAAGIMALRFRGHGRYAVGKAKGSWYRIRRHHPDEDVPDVVLADRIRSSIGPLEKRLDVPHVHVMVHDHVAKLHGDVSCRYEAERLENAVAEVCGVRGVDSFLHIGLLPSDTRPSTGHEGPLPPSHALTMLSSAAREAGAAQAPLFAVHAVLYLLLNRLPPDDRSDLLVHLPADVRVLAHPSYRRGPESMLRTPDDLYAAVAAADRLLTIDQAAGVTQAVLDALIELVPEEVRDVAGVLPQPLRLLWATSAERVTLRSSQRADDGAQL
jgi:uncharacterized protein (DUF2267 family)